MSRFAPPDRDWETNTRVPAPAAEAEGAFATV